MTLARLTSEVTELATELLVPFKAWARIDHDDDDASLTLTLARALDLLQRQWGVVLIPSEWRWVPRPEGSGLDLQTDNRLLCFCQHPAGRLSWSAVPVPIRGVSGFTVEREGLDVSAEFTLSGDIFYGDFGQTYLTSADGIKPADVVTLVGGPVNATDEADADMLPPAVVDVLFRYSLFLWENRESSTDKQMSEVPDWINRAWALFWVPRV